MVIWRQTSVLSLSSEGLEGPDTIPMTSFTRRVKPLCHGGFFNGTCIMPFTLNTLFTMYRYLWLDGLNSVILDK